MKMLVWGYTTNMQEKGLQTHIDGIYRDNWTTIDEQARQGLDQAIRAEDPEMQALQANQADVVSERGGQKIVDVVSQRSQSRVLFITQDPNVHLSGSMEQAHYLSLARWFDEVHIVLLKHRATESPKPLRLAENVWLYQFCTKYWWQWLFLTPQYMKDRFIFNDSVRPDILVATDVTESALVARSAAKVLGRKLQLHITEHPFKQTAAGEYKLRFLWRLFAKRMIRSAKNVLVATEDIKASVQKLNQQAAVQLLPQFYNFTAFKNSVPTFNLRERYTDYKLIIITFAPLTADSPLHDTITAVRSLLFKNQIGLVVVGSGPALQLFKDKVEMLGIKKKVVFLSPENDLVSLYQSADVLLETSSKEGNEEVVLRAIVSQLPIIAYETKLRLDLLEDGESAFLCPVGDSHCLTQKLSKFINSQAIRSRFRHSESDIAATRLVEDADSYYRTYRDLIEMVLLEPVMAEDNPVEGYIMPSNQPRTT